MLSREDKFMARSMFKSKILQADGQAFEDLFTNIMNYRDSDFLSIKPWGNIGDRKCDGTIEGRGIYYQVYAPEDISKSYPMVISKLQTDFLGLKDWWSDVKEFYFVVNDKYKGVNPDSLKAIKSIKEDHGLDRTGFIIAKDLENYLFELDDNQIESVIGLIPDPSRIKVLDFNVLNEVIGHIMGLPLSRPNVAKVVLPDWKEKIEFNHLSDGVIRFLNNGMILVNSLEEYLRNNSECLADDLRNRMNEIYIHNKDSYIGDDLFWAIVIEASPNDQFAYQSSVIVIMAKYFEACDIFEEPVK